MELAHNRPRRPAYHSHKLSSELKNLTAQGRIDLLNSFLGLGEMAFHSNRRGLLLLLLLLILQRGRVNLHRNLMRGVLGLELAHKGA